MDEHFFETIGLDENNVICKLRKEHYLNISQLEFDEIWKLHPEYYHTVKWYGKEVLTPRWQQSYGKSYSYTGSRNNALPIPERLKPFLNWSRENIDSRLNGLLLNWYDGEKGHYIGAHRDTTKDLLKDSPVVTISLGEERVFRFRPHKEKRKGKQDFLLENGSALVIPWNTNLDWTHEVPNFKRYSKKRISVTLRAYL
ncbi:MAG: alpha-ketoglutarate-dependent dioxygenase AlkB [Saprospiraceae bacterium]